MKTQSFMPPNLDKDDQEEDEDKDIHMNEKVICKVCKKKSNCKKVALPFVLRFMTNELASMGIKLTYNVTDF